MAYLIGCGAFVQMESSCEPIGWRTAPVNGLGLSEIRGQQMEMVWMDDSVHLRADCAQAKMEHIRHNANVFTYELNMPYCYPARIVDGC